jgi:hypothetical protein
MIGSTASLPNWRIALAIDLVSLRLQLMLLVVVLDTEASNNRKPIAAK